MKNCVHQKVDESVDKYNKTYHGTMEMKPPDVQLGIYIEYVIEHNKKDSKFKVGDQVRIPKFKNIFAKD